MTDQPERRPDDPDPDAVPDRAADPATDPATDPAADPLAALGDLLGGAGGGGGFDMAALLEQAAAMQSSIVTAQDELAAAQVEGAVAGGAVTVTVNGLGEMQGVEIRVGEFDGGDADSLTDLGDLVVAAYRDAKGRADALASAKLGPMAGGMGGAMGGGLGDLGDLGGPSTGGGGIGFTR